MNEFQDGWISRFLFFWTVISQISCRPQQLNIYQIVMNLLLHSYFFFLVWNGVKVNLIYIAYSIYRYTYLLIRTILNAYWSVGTSLCVTLQTVTFSNWFDLSSGLCGCVRQGLIDSLWPILCSICTPVIHLYYIRIGGGGAAFPLPGVNQDHSPRSCSCPQIANPLSPCISFFLPPPLFCQ